MPTEELKKYLILDDNSKDDESTVQDLLKLEIHHIVKAEYLESMLAANKLVLKRVMAWDDPYEAAILRRNILSDDKVVPISDSVKEIFGQCWTSKKQECDGLWRVYSDNRRNDVVRITTTVSDLLQAVLSSPFHNADGVDFAIGNVAYLPQSEIDKRNMTFDTRKARNACSLGEQCLFAKREEFAYEQEVRLLFLPMPNDKTVWEEKTGDGTVLSLREEVVRDTVPVPLGVPLRGLLSRVQFSPWMCRCEKEDFTKRFLARGFPKEKIESSDLYEPPLACAKRVDIAPEAEKWKKEPGTESEKEQARYRHMIGTENESEKSSNSGNVLENDELFTPEAIQERAAKSLDGFENELNIPGASEDSSKKSSADESDTPNQGA